jgi:hypothetical protein
MAPAADKNIDFSWVKPEIIVEMGLLKDDYTTFLLSTKIY